MAALAHHGIERAFPIQAATIADALAGRDVLGKARTGSGKTLGFGLPALTRLAQTGRPTPHRPRAVALVPTRELAMQVSDALEPYAHALHVSSRLVAGGLSMSKQIQSLERGVHLLIATPGRLADLVRRGHADLSETSLVILDEADHMAEMGFMEEITEILAGAPAGGQRLLFSATLDGDVDRLVSTYMTDPVLHDVTGGEDERSEMEHLVLAVPPRLKYQLATRIAAREGRTIVFVRTKLGCERVAEDMREAGVLAVALHGDKSQAERNGAITGFRAGSIPVLVATDVAARGIHVDSVDLVLQIDPPADPKDYTHRAGRTARAGAAGKVVTLALPHQKKTMDRMMAVNKVNAKRYSLKGEDEASLIELAELTGALEPSGIPVPEPRLNRYDRDRRGRGDRGPRDRGPRDRGARPHRRERETDTWAAEAAQERARLSAKERELAERERALAEREQRIAAAETRPAPAARRTSEGSRPRTQSQERRPSRDDRPRGGEWKGRDDRPRREDGSPARKPRHGSATRSDDARRDDDRREERAPRAKGGPAYGAKGPGAGGKGSGSKGALKGAGKKKGAPKPTGRSGKPRPKKKR